MWNIVFQDGREISVGDCALFKPPQDSPPFIGIIRWLTLDRENNLQLGVNWLYRPGEVKLGKGILRDAAPNEVFYSFHKDEIPAASLLHPCKVAFLPKGVELPSGISSFVCHRVYDIANRCLWWLTDQNYIDVSFNCLITSVFVLSVVKLYYSVIPLLFYLLFIYLFIHLNICLLFIYFSFFLSFFLSFFWVGGLGWGVHI